MRKMTMWAAGLLSLAALTAEVAHGAQGGPKPAPVVPVAPPVAVADPAVDCTLILPKDPLSATGLSTPFQLTNTHPGEVCHELDPEQSAFVQAAIIDPQTGQISIYAPLVIDAGTQPAVAPIVPTLPANAVVALWFGFNATNLKLQGSGNGGAGRSMNGSAPTYDAAHPGLEHEPAKSGVGSNGDPGADDGDGQLRANHCVNGLGASLFTQYSYCNAVAFFDAANAAVASGKLVVPQLAIAKDGKPCPQVRGFDVVDQDQSDNVPTTYLAFNGQVAQYNAANLAALTGATPFGNPSDNRLLDVLLDPALGCTPFTAPEISNPGVNAPALALNELQARANPVAPIALMPVNDPMTMVGTAYSLRKTNLYRAGVDQPLARSQSDADPVAYCANIRAIHPQKLILDKPLLLGGPSPFPLMADSLFTFMANRYVASYGLLNCEVLLKEPVNMTLTTNGEGVVTDAALVPDTSGGYGSQHH